MNERSAQPEQSTTFIHNDVHALCGRDTRARETKHNIPRFTLNLSRSSSVGLVDATPNRASVSRWYPAKHPAVRVRSLRRGRQADLYKADDADCIVVLSQNQSPAPTSRGEQFET